jgi:hypothetical protein
MESVMPQMPISLSSNLESLFFNTIYLSAKRESYSRGHFAWDYLSTKQIIRCLRITMTQQVFVCRQGDNSAIVATDSQKNTGKPELI